MLFSLIQFFLFIFVYTYLRVKVEGSYYTLSKFKQIKSDLWTRRHRHVNSVAASPSFHKLIFTRSLHTEEQERRLVNP